MAAFQLCFSIKKGIFKKKVSGEIAFELIIFFHGQTQEPTRRSTTTKAFVYLEKFANFIITKHLKQEIDGDLNACVDEHSSCDLPITGDIKTYHMECLMIKRYPQ